MRSFLLVTMVLAACGSDGVDLDDYDVRCVAVCTDEPNRPPGSGDVCDSASQQTCLDLCEARIAGQASLCQSCLLEDTRYSPDEIIIGDGGSTDCDAQGNCITTITGRGGSCSYNEDDQAMRDACYLRVYPERQVACEVRFQPVSDCAASCPAT